MDYRYSGGDSFHKFTNFNLNSMLIIGKGSIEEKVKKERELRSQFRKSEDIASGLTRKDVPMRNDYKLCREADKVLKDFRRFKNPQDRKKIESEYYGLTKEYRRV